MIRMIKMDDGFVFHLGQPPLHASTIGMHTVDKLDTSLLTELEEVEEEEERENRRKFEELHPDEAD